MSNKERVLVTGASGLIGRALLAELLHADKYELKGQVRNRQQAREKIGDFVDLTKIELLESDFTRASDKELQTLTKECEIVIHTAGLVHKVDATYQEFEVTNNRPTQHLAEAAAENGVKTFVFLSSSSVYGNESFKQVSETAALEGTTPYAVSKQISEKWLANFKKIPRIIIIRPSLVFGEGDRGNMLSLIRQIKSKRYFHIDNGIAQKSMIYAGDLAYAIALCLEKLPNGLHIFNAANPEPISMKFLTEEIAKSFNDSAKIYSLPAPLVHLGLAAARTLLPKKIPVTKEQLDKLRMTTTCSVNKLTKATDFKPKYSLKNALKNEIAWAIKVKLI